MHKAVVLVAAVLTGVLACALAVQLGDPTLKKIIKLVLFVCLMTVIAVTRQPKRVLLFTWIVALTYNRQYFSFDSIIGDYDSHGLYWVPADPVFAALLLIWVWERITGRLAPVAPSRALWPWVLPFVIACTVSALTAQHMVWSFNELARLVKFGLILLYIRYNFGKAEWWTAVAGVGCAILAQSALGVLQVAFNFGGSLSDLVRSETVHEHVAIEVMGSKRRRAVGTMVNPNIYGPYLLLVVPMFFGLVLTFRHMALRLLCGVVVVSGVTAVALTLSRLPWAVMAFDLVMLLVLLTWWNKDRVRSNLAVLIVGSLLTLTALLPQIDFIYDRFMGNFTESVEFRDRYNDIAIAMWTERPVLGIGLNHFMGDLGRYDTELSEKHEKWKPLRKLVSSRAIIPVHNLYLLILAETGTLGFVGILIVIVGVVRAGLHGVHRTSGAAQGACIGLLVAIGGQFIQQTMDFSLWVDPSFYTFALVVGLLNTAPGAVGDPLSGPPNQRRVTPAPA